MPPSPPLTYSIWISACAWSSPAPKLTCTREKHQGRDVAEPQGSQGPNISARFSSIGRKMRSAEYVKCRVWKMWGMENEEYNKFSSS